MERQVAAYCNVHPTEALTASTPSAVIHSGAFPGSKPDSTSRGQVVDCGQIQQPLILLPISVSAMAVSLPNYLTSSSGESQTEQVKMKSNHADHPEIKAVGHSVECFQKRYATQSENASKCEEDLRRSKQRRGRREEEKGSRHDPIQHPSQTDRN